MSTTETSPSPALPLFTAPFKKRKLQHLRRRRSNSPDSTDASTPSPAQEAAQTPPPAAAIHRARLPKRRLGLEVHVPKPRNPDAAAAAEEPPQTAEEKEAEADVLAVVNRFTRQTGQVLDVDKHMVAYVEGEMARRRGVAAAGASGSGTASADSSAAGEAGMSGGSYWVPTRPEARGATLGKLHEVDLGAEAKELNIRRTQAALGPGDEPQPSPPQQQAKSKGRKRRNSQDVARDRLVEEVLKETRLDLYNTGEDEEQDLEEGDEEGAADDRIAEKFRKEFIDALASKRRRRHGDTAAKKDDKKRPKGPKLGGSRMARAAMRETQGGAK